MNFVPIPYRIVVNVINFQFHFQHTHTFASVRNAEDEEKKKMLIEGYEILLAQALNEWFQSQSHEIDAFFFLLHIILPKSVYYLLTLCRIAVEIMSGMN